MAANCKKCGDPLTNHKNSFCTPCAKAARQEMWDSGYLQPIPKSKKFADRVGRKIRDSKALGGRAENLSFDEQDEEERRQDQKDDDRYRHDDRGSTRYRE